ncbi:MAG: hydroxylamine reductase [Syntrophomonadaceae bacterium]|nr:hydroxylamine reductase [Syntrophomonadaceae bacterium]
MFCNQCEQTSKGTGCAVVGVCGKKPEVAALLDLLTYSLSQLSEVAREARTQGIVDAEINRFTCDALFVTLTNVNFDPAAIEKYINRAAQYAGELSRRAGLSAPGFKTADRDGLVQQGEACGYPGSKEADADIRSLKEILLYGIRGVAAYAHHAAILGQEDDTVYAFIHEAMAGLIGEAKPLEEWLGMVLQCGEVNLRAMELLDAGNTSTFGHPEPTPVKLGHQSGKCVLVSGHDLKDLKDLLEQTEGKGINIYTHGEMLPAHAYPELKQYKHLAGHYGTAWQNQKKEFAVFPGPILMTTNCIQAPELNYIGSIFTTGAVGWPGVTHLQNGQFAELINKAIEMPGFGNDEDKGTVLTGFARNAVLGVADKVIAAVKSGAIKRFVLVGGCDGAKSGRNYYTELVDRLPDDTVVLTLACGKFRFFDHQLGDIGGIPRLLDVGQCNDAYSAVQIAVALANAFECGVNDLPLSMVLSWYEQKAVSILLTLLYLDIKNIRLGPSLPAFVSPNVLQVLVDKFGIKPIATVEEDLAAIVG